jgi:hypothetical protein
MMAHAAPNPETRTIASLRVALHRLDYLTGPTPCQSAVAHARRALLLQLANAEAELALIENLAPANAESRQILEIAAWPLTLSIADIEALEESSQKIPPDKLD